MGFYVEEPQEYHKTPLPDLVGPIVRLSPCTSQEWKAVVLVVHRAGNNSNSSSQSSSLTCEWRIERDGATWTRLQGTILDTTSEWRFSRFTLPSVPLKDAQVLQYRIRNQHAVSVSASIPIPARGKEWNVIAYSCFDQRRGYGHRLWKNITGVSPGRADALMM
jgi:hypothetical protein